jgi:hypothetical protein
MVNSCAQDSITLHQVGPILQGVVSGEVQVTFAQGGKALWKLENVRLMPQAVSNSEIGMPFLAIFSADKNESFIEGLCSILVGDEIYLHNVWISRIFDQSGIDSCPVYQLVVA